MPLKSFLKKAKAIQQDLEFQRHPRPKKHESGEVDESNWLISYADMMTLLCTFFVLMFTLSKLNQPEYEKVGKEVAAYFGKEYELPNNQLAKSLTQILEQAGLEKTQAAISSDQSGVTVIFQSSIFFDTLSSYIRKSGREVIGKMIEAIEKEQQKTTKKYKVVVEGHTDSRPILTGNYPSNWELSSARAIQVIRLFLDKGFKADQILAIGFGASRQQSPERTDSGKWDLDALAKNRRVVIRILQPETNTIPWEQQTAAKESPQDTI